MVNVQNGTGSRKDVSIIISAYNEKAVLNNLKTAVIEALHGTDFDYEVIFVNDGSTDGSAEIISKICTENSNFKEIHFSTNFGHEAAMIAGIDYAKGEAVICMDADLQHPPGKIPEMLDKHKNGFDIVNMVRSENDDAGIFSSFFSKMFYRVINAISPVKLLENASDFFLISHRVAAILRNDFRERNRFLRGFIQIIGFKKTSIAYKASSRSHGKTKYSFLKLIKLSLNAIASFSRLPLHLGIGAGVIFGLFSIIVGIYSIIMHMLDSPPPGYTTLVVLISFAFSIQFFLIGFIGIYVGYNFEESKKRPIYIIEKQNVLDKELVND